MKNRSEIDVKISVRTESELWYNLLPQLSSVWVSSELVSELYWYLFLDECVSTMIVNTLIIFVHWLLLNNDYYDDDDGVYLHAYRWGQMLKKTLKRIFLNRN